jgi:hypothetical protein
VKQLTLTAWKQDHKCPYDERLGAEAARAATFPTGSGYQVNAVAFSPNGTLLAVG